MGNADSKKILRLLIGFSLALSKQLRLRKGFGSTVGVGHLPVVQMLPLSCIGRSQSWARTAPLLRTRRYVNAGVHSKCVDPLLSLLLGHHYAHGVVSIRGYHGTKSLLPMLDAFVFNIRFITARQWDCDAKVFSKGVVLDINRWLV
jgi:hypothetical protein